MENQELDQVFVEELTQLEKHLDERISTLESEVKSIKQDNLKKEVLLSELKKLEKQS